MVAQFADQDYVVLADGTILAVHGDLHPPGFVVGEIAFLPDLEGDRPLLGRKYKKAYTNLGRGLPESRRPMIRATGDTPVHDAHLFSFKSILDVGQIVEHVPAFPLPDPSDLGEPAGQYFVQTLAKVRELFEVSLTNVSLGLTGAIRLSTSSDAVLHDLDLVFRGPPNDLRELVRAMSELTRTDPDVRIFEHGKSWQIRLQTERGMLCSFFAYENPEVSPLAGLRSMRVVLPEVTVQAEVLDDMHNFLLPTVLTVTPRSWSMNLPPEARSELIVMINHLRSRGEFFAGDVGTFTGALVEVATSDSSYLALSVIDGDNSTLLTPPWAPYYRNKDAALDPLGRRRLP